jgi:hypothetical protein
MPPSPNNLTGYSLLGNSELRSQPAGRFVLQLQPYTFSEALTIGAPPATSIPVAMWETDDVEPQELEALIWYESALEGSGMADNADLPETVAWILSKSVGGIGGPALNVNIPLMVPANGLRFRFAARSVTLRAFAAYVATPITCVVRAGIYPTAGISDGPDACITSGAFYQPVPKGARRFRVVPGAADATSKVEFYSLTTGFTGAGDVSTVNGYFSRPIASFSNQVGGDWMPVPRGAYWMIARTTWTSSAQGSRLAYGAEVHFQ